MGVVPGAFAGVGEDLVGVDELLERGGGGSGGEAGLDELVGVALEGELLVGGADLVGGTVEPEAEDLVQASLLQRRRRSHC